MFEPKIFGIPDKVSEKAGLAARWIPGDKLAAHAYQHVTAFSEDKPSKFAPCKAMVHQLRLDVMLFDPVTRKLINESSGAFLAGQKVVDKDNTNDIRPELLKLSRQYRSIIRACLENLREEERKASDDQKETYLNLVTVFYNVEFLWHLCEILYVDAVPGDVVLPQIIEWIRFHFFHCERQAQALLMEQQNMNIFEDIVENRPDYWETVIGLVLVGQIDGVRSLLQLHSASKSEPFKSADYALRMMPVYNVYGGLSISDFSIRWKSWQLDCLHKLNTEIYTSNKHLHFIMKIIAGDEEAFIEVKSHCKNWYRFMAAWLLYTEPTVKSHDLSFHATKCIAQFGGMAQLNNTDHILLSLLEADLHEVINRIQRTTENGWFSAHLTNLLYLCGSLKMLDKCQMNLAAKMHESLLVDYGTLLMSHQSLWQVGVGYLDHCPREGRARLELLLQRVPLTTEARALKVIHVARTREMHNVVASICKVLGMRSYQQNRLGNALTWALRSQDAGFATFLADKFLQLYCREGKFHSTDILDYMGSCMLVSDRLTFLGKYCEFHQLYRAGEFRDASVLLVNLLISKLAPKYFWLTLLTDALPLLESNDIILTSEDTYELLNCLEELIEDNMQIDQDMISQGYDTEESKVESRNNLEEKMGLIRLALARNLARSINHEGCLAD